MTMAMDTLVDGGSRAEKLFNLKIALQLSRITDRQTKLNSPSAELSLVKFHFELWKFVEK